MADNDLGLEVWSLPHVGTFAKRLVLSKLVESFTFNDRFNGSSDGHFTIPDDATLIDGTFVKDRILKVDESDHANDVGSVVRILRGTTPVHHQIVIRAEDRWSEGDPTVKYSTEGLEWILDKVLVPNYDSPADPTKEPDWIYGADSILANPGLENSFESKEVQFFSHTQTSSTYTITFDGATTAALDWDATWFDVHEALEDLANIQDVVVEGDGSATSPFEITFLDPDGDVPLLTSTATGASITVFTVGGVKDPTGWTKSFHPQTGQLHGQILTFEVASDQAHSGTYSLKVVAGPNTYPTDFPGVQQIVSVTGGRTYRASIWVRATSARSFRLVCRTTDETLIEGALVETAVSANTWTEMVIAPFEVPIHIDQIIFRLGLIETDGATFWVDDGVFAPGFPAATLGEMFTDIRTAAIAAGSPLSWLTPTWTPSLDSNGNAWDEDRKWNVNHGQSFLQLIEYARRGWNYESRIRWDAGDARFEWDMWNPTGGGSATTVAITGKSGVTGSAPIVKRPPGATFVRTEGDQGHWGESASTTLDDVWGRLERFHFDRQGVASDELEELATRLVTHQADQTASRAVTVRDATHKPWTDYSPGDTVTLNLAPKDTKQTVRVASVVASMNRGEASPSYDVHFGAPVYTNEAAQAQGLRTLLREFRRPVSTAPAAKPQVARPSTGTPFVVVSAVDSPAYFITAAAFRCDGVHDEIEVQAGINYVVNQGGGYLVLAPGAYNISASLSITEMTGPLYILGHGAHLIAQSSIINILNARGKPIINQIKAVEGLEYTPTCVIDGVIFDGDDVAFSTGIVVYGGGIDCHIAVTRCMFQRLNGKIIYCDSSNDARFDIENCTFINMTLDAHGATSPACAGIQFNDGGAQWIVRVSRNHFEDIEIGGDYAATVDLSQGAPAPSIVTENMALNCTRTGGGGSVFLGNAVFDNWINGTFTAEDS